MGKMKVAVLLAAAFFFATAVHAQQREPSAWMNEIGPVIGIRGMFGANEGAEACYGLDYAHYHWNGLGFRTGVRYMPEYSNIDNAVWVPLAFSWRTHLRTKEERLQSGVSSLFPYSYGFDSPDFMTVVGAFLLNLFSRFELFAGVTPGYVFGQSEIYRREFRDSDGYEEEGIRVDHPFSLSLDAGFALSYRIWRFNLRVAPSVHYNLTDNYHLWYSLQSESQHIARHSDKALPWSASLDFGLLWQF